MTTFPARIDADGKLKLDDRAAFEAVCQRYKRRPMVLILQTPESYATTQLHRYYRGLVLPSYVQCVNLAREQKDEPPLTDAAVHRMLKTALRGAEPTDSSADWSVREFSQFIAWVREDAEHRFGVHIPEPHEWEGE